MVTNDTRWGRNTLQSLVTKWVSLPLCWDIEDQSTSLSSSIWRILSFSSSPNSEGLFGEPIRQAMARHRERILLIFQGRVTSVVPLHLYFRHLLTRLLLVTNCPLCCLYFLLPSFLVTQNVSVLLYFLTCSKFGFTSIHLPICSCTSDIQVAFVLLISPVSH